MDGTQIESQVRIVLAEVSGGREVADSEATLTEQGFDSLSKVEVIVGIEKMFDIRLGEADISGTNFATLGAIVRLLEQRLA